ncbi:hypothetical protein DICVIV_00626 [Dictyocaulus viviparus]|uniref:Ricin B lectin domain-containing protein n=1 Tax=Dictyocaulus viviparus TaxID=29172 RepID=A0A0D8Y8F2_DICVI|nr:hypothetical protein DICVIV_00626 [Dictyocaulus viviparus]
MCQEPGSSSEVFSLSKQLELRRETTCVEVGRNIHTGVHEAILQECNEEDTIQYEHTEGGVLRHKKRGLCLDVEGVESGGNVTFSHCDDTKSSQQWRFDKYFKLDGFEFIT